MKPDTTTTMTKRHKSTLPSGSPRAEKGSVTKKSQTTRVRNTQTASKHVMSPLEIVEKASSMGFFDGSRFITANVLKGFPFDAREERRLLEEQTCNPSAMAKLIDQIRSYGNMTHDQFLPILRLTKDVETHVRSGVDQLLIDGLMQWVLFFLNGKDHDLVFTMQVLGDHWDVLRSAGGFIGDLREDGFARFESSDPEQQARLRLAFMLPHEARLFRAMPDAMLVGSGGSFPELCSNRYFVFDGEVASTVARRSGSMPAVLSGIVAKEDLLGVKMGVNGTEVVLGTLPSKHWNIEHLPSTSPTSDDTDTILARVTGSVEDAVTTVRLPMQRAPQGTLVSLN